MRGKAGREGSTKVAGSDLDVINAHSAQATAPSKETKGSEGECMRLHVSKEALKACIFRVHASSIGRIKTRRTAPHDVTILCCLLLCTFFCFWANHHFAKYVTANTGHSRLQLSSLISAVLQFKPFTAYHIQPRGQFCCHFAGEA